MKKYCYLLLLLVFGITSFSLASCGDDNDDAPGSGSSSIIGTWSASYYDDGDLYHTSMTFKNNGECLIEESGDGESYSVKLKYTLTGDPSESTATLRLTGRTVDGDHYDNTYNATIRGKKLTLICIAGEGVGERMELTRK